MMKTQEDIEAKLLEDYPLSFMDMLFWQERFIRCKNDAGRTPRRRLAELGNKSGKTEVGLAEDIAHALGYRPWLPKDDPDHKIDVKVPNQGLIGCETMMHSVPQKIEPTLKRLIPNVCKPHFKPGPTGVCIRVTLKYDTEGKKCGSIMHIRSYDQRPDTYEGIDYDWIHWDEPPPEVIFKAAERGKVTTNAPSWFTMTPLKEPYIYDQFSLKADIEPEIEVVRGAIWENCRDRCHRCEIDIPENLEDRVLSLCPKCKEVLGFIPKMGIEEYLKTLDPEEREAREKGIWKHLSGLIYKELDRDIHVYDDFNIPRDWMFVEGVDPHDARPTRWLFGAVSPEEIELFTGTKNPKQRNRIYFYDSLQLKGDLAEIVRQVKGKRAFHGYKEPKMVVLDAKFGVKTQIEHKSWQSELEKHGINRIKLSRSNPGDVGLGHKVVKEYLKMHHSPLLSKEKPGMLFAKDGCGGDKGVIHSMFNYQWKVNTDKPEEKFKDFCDAVRYVAMEQPLYISPQREKEVEAYLKGKMDKAVSQRRA